MRRAIGPTAVLALAACTAALMIAGPATGAQGQTVTKGHFEYALYDDHLGRDVHFVCDEVRRETTGGAARETIHCKTDDRTNKSAVIYSPAHLFGGLYPWYSDFTGQESVDFHLVGTPSGNLEGWATY